MKTFYIVNQSIMNGTVTVDTMQSCFNTKELAEKVIAQLKEDNKDMNHFHIIYKIKQVNLFEDESEVPCLNKQENGNENSHNSSL